ncbi:MAG: hypothetical protein AAFV53_06130 [Myxococcota bacterium]
MVRAPLFAVVDGDLGLPGLADVIAQGWQGSTAPELFAFLHNINQAHEYDAGVAALAATLNHAQIHLTWVGDCCAFHVRDGRLERMTRPDLLVEVMVDQGKLPAQDAREHPHGKIMMQVLGIGKPDIHRAVVFLHPGEQLLLCTDGVWQAPSPPTRQSHAQAYVEAALKSGSKDNVSAILFEHPL